MSTEVDVEAEVIDMVEGEVETALYEAEVTYSSQRREQVHAFVNHQTVIKIPGEYVA